MNLSNDTYIIFIEFIKKIQSTFSFLSGTLSMVFGFGQVSERSLFSHYPPAYPSARDYFMLAFVPVLEAPDPSSVEQQAACTRDGELDEHCLFHVAVLGSVEVANGILDERRAFKDMNTILGKKWQVDINP